MARPAPAPRPARATDAARGRLGHLRPARAGAVVSAQLTLWARMEDPPDVEELLWQRARAGQDVGAARHAAPAPHGRAAAVGRRAGGAQAALRAEVVAQALQAHAGGRARRSSRASRRRCATGPLTREELAERVHPGLAPRLRRPAQAGRVPRRADLRRRTDALRAARSRSSRMDTEEATQEIARRFLTRYGPATREDAREVVRAPVAGAQALDQVRSATRWSRPSSAGRWRRDVAAIEAAEPSGVVGCCPRSTSTSSPRRATSGRRPRPERIYRPGGWFSPSCSSTA